MADQELIDALGQANEVDLTVVGRKSGRESTRPLWFVLEGDAVYLVPIYGTDTGWYKNVLKTPAIRLRAGAGDAEATTTPITDEGRLDQIRDAFRAKYGARQFQDYYPKPDAAVEISFG